MTPAVTRSEDREEGVAGWKKKLKSLKLKIDIRRKT